MTSRSSGPDVLPPVTTMGEIESRMGIPSIESLLAERDSLVKQVATLRARHGPGGVFDNERKAMVAKLAARLRGEAAEQGRKVTEASLEEAAHAHDEYGAFLADGLMEKAKYFELDNQIMGIGDTIRRGDVVGRYLSAEIGLTR